MGLEEASDKNILLHCFGMKFSYYLLLRLPILTFPMRKKNVGKEVKM